MGSLQVGELALACIRRKVTRGADSVELAPKEFSILEYLMRNRGRPLLAKLIYSAITSLDGYVADENGGFDWAAPDQEVHSFVNVGSQVTFLCPASPIDSANRRL